MTNIYVLWYLVLIDYVTTFCDIFAAQYLYFSVTPFMEHLLVIFQNVYVALLIKGNKLCETIKYPLQQYLFAHKCNNNEEMQIQINNCNYK